MDRTTRQIVWLSASTVALLLLTACCLIAMRPTTCCGTDTPVGVPRVAESTDKSVRATSPVAAPPRRHQLDVSYGPLIEDAAYRNNLPPVLVAAITRVESDFHPYELSNKGARGLMQVMPETGARFGVPSHLLFDPEHNIAAGTAYLSWLLDRYNGDLDLALAGYNAGEGAVDRYRGIPPYRETQDYVRKVRMTLSAMQRR